MLHPLKFTRAVKAPIRILSVELSYQTLAVVCMLLHKMHKTQREHANGLGGKQKPRNRRKDEKHTGAMYDHHSYGKTNTKTEKV